MIPPSVWDSGLMPFLYGDAHGCSAVSAKGHDLPDRSLVDHHFGLDDMTEAFDVFARATDTGAVKVVLTR